jgi:hypothetical protein
MLECKCKSCGKKPEELDEYVQPAEELGITPERYVVTEEGTYNPETGLFFCTPCYVKAGMPLGKA